MTKEIQECKEIVAGAMLLIGRLRESPIGTEERIVQKIGAMLLDKDPQAVAMVAVVAMIMLADAQEEKDA